MEASLFFKKHKPEVVFDTSKRSDGTFFGGVAGSMLPKCF